MKRIALLGVGLILLVACISGAQEPVYYNSNPTLGFFLTDLRPDLEPLATGDTIEVRGYAWDIDNGDIVLQPVAGLDHRATQAIDPFTSSGEQLLSLDFAYTAVNGWAVALAATHIDGGGNRTDYSDLLYSTVEGDTASGVPFVYIRRSGPTSSGAGVTGLRDSGM